VTLEQLRLFVAVAERAHVTRAAEELGLAQSAVSGAIAALESRHGVRLFHRQGRGIGLTEAGALFLPEARAVLARAAAAERMLAEIAGLRRGTLAVQASQTIAGYWLPRRLADFRRDHPGIDIRLDVGNTAQVAAALRQGVAELGFVEGAVDEPALEARRVARDQLVVVVAPGHPWARCEPAGPADLAAGEWVLREAGSGTRSEFMAALRGFGIDPAALRVALELPSNEAVRAAVEAGLGATAISASVAAASIEAGRLHHVRVALPERDFVMLRQAGRTPSPAALAFMTLTGGA
jgi:DNA-binding transcriptional LysR family regulator